LLAGCSNTIGGGKGNERPSRPAAVDVLLDVIGNTQVGASSSSSQGGSLSRLPRVGNAGTYYQPIAVEDVVLLLLLLLFLFDAEDLLELRG
jgi:hypothetical protein